MKIQGQIGKCKDDIKSYSLDCFEQVEQSKRPHNFWTKFLNSGQSEPSSSQGKPHKTPQVDFLNGPMTIAKVMDSQWGQTKPNMN